MSQIVKRKKKGRPLKVDRNSRVSPETEERDIRRSLRPRNVKYVFDLDDYFDDELFEDDEDHRQREKKLKHLLKRESSNESDRGRSRRVGHAPATSASSDDEDIQKPSKKRKIYDHFDDDDTTEFNEKEEDEIVRDRMPETKAEEFSPPETPSRILLPDKKVLELILDKLQKKDIYGVYAEPVDPEELPDYHELIENPMDFATVRNNLRNGSYVTLDQLESDVFLICSNAMQYNEPVTIYYKQARSIQELAKRKFDKLRSNVEYSEKLRKPEKKVRPGFISKKRVGWPVRRALQEPVVSDFSSGATPATPVDLQNVSNVFPSVGYERPRSLDRPVWESSLASDNNLNKGEELLAGKGQLGRSFRKPLIADENRRATYDISLAHHPMASSESIFSTFEEESKQLVPVGLYSDHSYARSLARFAATIGSDAWEFASKRIEQVLPEEFKFGRGWVGDYEPLPTPVLIQENCIVKEPPFLKKEFRVDDPKKIPMVPCSFKENPISVPLGGKMLPFPVSSTVRPPSTPINIAQHAVDEKHARPNVSKDQQPFFKTSRIDHCASPNLNYLLQNSQPLNSLESDKKILQQIESNNSPSLDRIFAADPAEASRSIEFMSNNATSKHVELNQPTSLSRSLIADPRDNMQVSRSSESEVSRSTEFGSFKRVDRLPSLNKSLADTSEHRQMSKRPQMEVSRSMVFASRDANFSKSGFLDHDSNGITAGLPNGRHCSSSGMANAVQYNPNEQGQGLSDPVHMMKMLAERSNNQQKSTNQSMEDARQVFYSTPPSNVNSNNAAAAAAHVWMSVGAGRFIRPNGENSNMMQKNLMYADSIYNSTIRDSQSPMMQFQVQSSRNNHCFSQGMGLGNGFQNQQMVFPQMVTADLSSFQMQPTWQNITPQIQTQKQEMLPPDLNIGFHHSSGSPSGVFVDSQQPDLALQL